MMLPAQVESIAQPGPSTDYETTRYKEFACGWGAGCIETCILFPANKIIFRQQLHGYTIIKAVRQIKSEGVSNLYRGLLSPLLMRTSSRAIMFGLYDDFKHRLGCDKRPAGTLFTLCHSQAAFLAGACEASMCPLERVQVLMQTSKYQNQFRNTGDALTSLYRQYGIREYYRGISVVVTRNGLSNILFFSLREPFKEWIMDSRPPVPAKALGMFSDFCSGALLGASISTLFFPFNVVKNRMQSNLGTSFDGPFKVFGILWHERQGWKELYRGVHLNVCRSLVAWGITNTFYELLRQGLFE